MRIEELGKEIAQMVTGLADWGRTGSNMVRRPTRAEHDSAVFDPKPADVAATAKDVAQDSSDVSRPRPTE